MKLYGATGDVICLELQRGQVSLLNKKERYTIKRGIMYVTKKRARNNENEERCII